MWVELDCIVMVGVKLECGACLVFTEGVELERIVMMGEELERIVMVWV